ncbi:FAD-binding domain-containing protein [Xylariaceae sp. FL0662B]|nr:FAD-binding domain-containing protein [Xylariaceae sp. FL0662B]
MPDSGNLQVLNALTGVLGDSILQPGSEEYERNNGSYFSAFQIAVRPLYIAKPNSVKQVHGLIKALRPYVLSGACQVAIRGTGHTPFAGSSNVHNGVTIDMRGLKGIRLSQDKSIVEIGVGETWGTVYTELEKHGITTAGGRAGRVGVGGFILGGGLSMFSTRKGFSCDLVVEFEVVLASGEVVRASSGEKPDLWIALRGGLNNFGIVTSFKMNTFKSGDIWGGLTYYMQNTFSQLLHKAYDFAYDETDEDTHIFCSIGYGYTHQAVTCVMFHTQGEENPPSLQRFTAMGPQIKEKNTMRTAKHLDFCEELSKFTTDGFRQYFTTLTIKPDIPLMEAFYAKRQETLAMIEDAEGLIFSFSFHPLTRSLLENSKRAGGNAMAIPPSDGPLFVLLINPIWVRPEDDDRIYTAVGNFVAELRRLAAEKGLLHRYIFTNYGFEKDDIFTGYGEESLSKLKVTSKKYDPEGIFQKGVPGGFKLPNADD